MESIPTGAKATLEDYVKKGGGLVWIAGEHNVYVDKKVKPEMRWSARCPPNWRRRDHPRARR
jgi:hypothetical protein